MNFLTLSNKLHFNVLKNTLRLITVCFCFISFMSVSYASPVPSSCNNKKLKVAVVSAGIQKNTMIFFTRLLNELGTDGFVSNNDLPLTIDLSNREEYKKSVSEIVKGKCLEFPSELSYFSNWNPKQLESHVADLKDKIAKKEVDMIFSFGDLSSSYLVNQNSNVPLLCFDVNAPAKIGELAKNNKQTVIMDDTRNIVDDIRLFHDIYGYTGLGYFRDVNHIYDDYVVFDDVESYAKSINVPLTVCEGEFFTPDKELARKEFSRCVKEISSHPVNVVFVPEVGNGIDDKFFFSQLRPLLSRKIAVISSDSKSQVKSGSLFSLYDPEEGTRVHSSVEAIEDLVTNNFDVSSIKSNFAVPMFFGVNLKTAGLVQWRPSFEIMVAVDDVFHSVDSR